MNPFLLDTNIIVNVLRRHSDAELLVSKLLDEGHPLAACSITITEIYAGMRPREEKATRAFMKSLVFLPTTAEIAERAGLLKAQYAHRGKVLSVQDVTITAVCIAYGCTLVTENIKDFPMSELRSSARGCGIGESQITPAGPIAAAHVAQSPLCDMSMQGRSSSGDISVLTQSHSFRVALFIQCVI
jgi:predicted nucleic acid-binding protein